jgi:hypothetical protein
VPWKIRKDIKFPLIELGKRKLENHANGSFNLTIREHTWILIFSLPSACS